MANDINTRDFIFKIESADFESPPTPKVPVVFNFIDMYTDFEVYNRLKI